VNYRYKYKATAKKELPISWKFIFNSSLSIYFMSEFAREAAEKACYPYFTWNGFIYETSTGKNTDIKMSDYNY
jgi:hypothetical protein